MAGLDPIPSLSYWRYFLAIEADLENALRYVELSPANFKTYSIELARILLGACSEIDSVCKVLCGQINPEWSPAGKNIDDYRKLILSRFPRLPMLQIFIPRYSLAFEPWETWQSDKNPAWWHGHNKVKRRRHECFEEANLENAVDAVGGLFALNLYHYCKAVYSGGLEPPPRLFSVDGFPCGVLLAETSTAILPDFPPANHGS